MRGAPLFLDGNDDEAEVRVTRKNVDTGIPEALAGVSGLTFRLAATRDGAAIDSSLSKTAVQRATDTTLWYAIFEGTDLTSKLASYAGKDVYQVFGDGQNVNFNVARRVYAVRP